MISFQTGKKFKLEENNEEDISNLNKKFFEESISKNELDKIIQEIDIEKIDTYHKDTLKNYAKKLGLYKKYNNENDNIDDKNFKPLNDASKKGEIKTRLMEFLYNLK